MRWMSQVLYKIIRQLAIIVRNLRPCSFASLPFDKFAIINNYMFSFLYIFYSIFRHFALVHQSHISYNVFHMHARIGKREKGERKGYTQTFDRMFGRIIKLIMSPSLPIRRENTVFYSKAEILFTVHKSYIPFKGCTFHPTISLRGLSDSANETVIKYTK